MRWAALFQDFEAQLDAAQRADLNARSSELARVEAGAVELADRFRAAHGRQLRLRLRNGRDVIGVVDEVASTWLLLSTQYGATLIPAHAVDVVHQLDSGAQSQRSEVRARLGLGHTLRALARDRVLVRVATVSGDITGMIDQVGRDYLEVGLADEPGGPGRRRERALVPFHALVGVSEMS